MIRVVIFAFLAMLFWGIEDFVAQKTARKIGDLESLAAIMIIGTIILFPFAVKDFKMLFSAQTILIFLIVSVIHFIGGLFYFESLKEGKLSVIDVIFEFELPITIILSLIFFKENLSVLQFFLVGIIFVGIFLIATKSFSHLKIKFEKGLFIALIAAFFMALINFGSAYSVRITSPILTLWIIWAVNSIFCIIYLTYKNKFNFCKNCWKIKWKVLIIGITATFAWLFYFIAIRKNELAIITAITEAYPVISITLGLLINNEKIKWQQYLGMALSLISAIILSFSIINY